MCTMGRHMCSTQPERQTYAHANTHTHSNMLANAQTRAQNQHINVFCCFISKPSRVPPPATAPSRNRRVQSSWAALARIQLLSVRRATVLLLHRRRQRHHVDRAGPNAPVTFCGLAHAAKTFQLLWPTHTHAEIQTLTGVPHAARTCGCGWFGTHVRKQPFHANARVLHRCVLLCRESEITLHKIERVPTPPPVRMPR